MGLYGRGSWRRWSTPCYNTRSTASRQWARRQVALCHDRRLAARSTKLTYAQILAEVQNARPVMAEKASFGVPMGDRVILYMARWFPLRP